MRYIYTQTPKGCKFDYSFIVAKVSVIIRAELYSIDKIAVHTLYISFDLPLNVANDIIKTSTFYIYSPLISKLYIVCIILYYCMLFRIFAHSANFLTHACRQWLKVFSTTYTKYNTRAFARTTWRTRDYSRVFSMRVTAAVL